MSAFAAESPARVSSVLSEWEHRRVFGDAATVGILTTVAKLVGAVKVIVTARFFGTSDAADAFLIAFLLPSFLSDVVAGSFTPSLVPLLVRCKITDGPEAVDRLIRGALGMALGAMLVAAVALALTGRWLLPLAGSSFPVEKLHLAMALFFGLLFWLPMSACIATWKAVLNASHAFALAAIAPLATPLLTIVLLFAFARKYGVAILCVGTVAGVAAECLLLALSVRKLGFPLGARFRGWTRPEFRSLRNQYFPLAASAIISSACVLVDQSIAGRLGPGKVAALTYGNKLAAVFLAVVASALSTAVLPAFSRLAAANDWKRLRRAVVLFSGSAVLLVTPLAALFIAYSPALVRAFFQHGVFESSAAQVVSDVQRFALLQAPFAILLAIATRLASALSANRLLVWMGVMALLTDIVLDIAFSRWLGVAGIALASSTVSLMSFLTLAVLLYRHRPEVFSEGAR